MLEQKAVQRLQIRVEKILFGITCCNPLILLSKPVNGF